MVPGGALCVRRGRCPARANLRQRKEAGPGPGPISACAGACRPGRRGAYACMPARWSWPCCCRCPPAAATGPAPPAPMSWLPPGEVSYTPPGEALRKGYPVTPAPLTARFPNGLAIMTRQVSQAEYAACVRAGGCRTPDPAQRGATAPDMPAAGISWSDASAYAAWLSAATGRQLRLPTYAEWVYAAGPAFIDDALAPSADDGDPAQRWLAEYDQQARRAQAGGSVELRPFGGHGANPAGLQDMAGSVWTGPAIRPHAPRAGRGARRGRTGSGQLRHSRTPAGISPICRTSSATPRAEPARWACRPPTWACGWCWRTRAGACRTATAGATSHPRRRSNRTPRGAATILAFLHGLPDRGHRDGRGLFPG